MSAYRRARYWFTRKNSLLFRVTGNSTVSSALNYRRYGCFCGGRAKGKPVDEIDRYVKLRV